MLRAATGPSVRRGSRYEAGARGSAVRLQLRSALGVRAADLLLPRAGAQQGDHDPAGQGAHVPPHGEHAHLTHAVLLHLPRDSSVTSDCWFAEDVRGSSTDDLYRCACESARVRVERNNLSDF